MPFNDGTYDGVICVFATHHMSNLVDVFKEVNRIIKQRDKFIILTGTPEQMRNYWLCEYFPNMINDSQQVMKSFEELKNILVANGFSNIKQHPFFVTNELQDLFLQSGKYRPEIYLDENVRNRVASRMMWKSALSNFSLT